MAVTAGAGNDAYFLIVGGGGGDFFTIYRLPNGQPTPEKYLDMSSYVGVATGGGEDLDYDPATNRFFVTDGINIWCVNADKTVTRLYQGTIGYLGDAGVYGVFFDRKQGVLYAVGADIGVVKMNPDNGNILAQYSSPGGTLHDVAVDASGRLYLAVWGPKRTTQNIVGSSWTDLYYWYEAGANSRWMPVANGFIAGRGLTADRSGNIFVSNWMSGAVSVVGGLDPTVFGFMRVGTLAAAAAVSGDCCWFRSRGPS